MAKIKVVTIGRLYCSGGSDIGKLTAEKNYVPVEGIPADTTVKIVFFKNDITADYTRGLTKYTDSINMTAN